MSPPRSNLADVVGDRSLRVHKALAHPLRKFILGYLIDHGTCSAVEISRAFGAEVGTTAYHLRFLRDQGFVRLVREIPRRGATEFQYRLVENGPLGITMLTRAMHRGPIGKQARALGETLRAARKRTGLSEARAAASLLIPIRAVAAIEAGTASPALYKLLEFTDLVHLELVLIPTDDRPYADVGDER